jgi:hypothetical protein
VFSGRVFFSVLDGGEIFPYLMMFIYRENLVVLPRSIISLQVQKLCDDIRKRVDYNFRSESRMISKHLFYKLIIVIIAYLRYVPLVGEFDFFLELIES